MRLWSIVLLSVVGCGSGGYVVPPSPPKTAFLLAPAAMTSEASAAFGFSADQPGATYRAWLDDVEVDFAGDSLVVTGLDDGRHMLEVSAVAPSGLHDKSPARHFWTVDTTAPIVRVSFPPERALTDQPMIAVCGSAEDAGGIARVTVDGYAATTTDGFRHWRAIVPVRSAHSLRVEVDDLVGHAAVDTTRTVVRVAPPATLPEIEPRDEFELSIDESDGEAIVVEPDCVTAIDLESGDRRVLSDATHGTGTDFEDIVVMTEIPGKDEIAVFDTKDCRIFTVDLGTGNRTVVWDQLGPGDIPANREGLIASDGTHVYVQGPRQGTLVELELDGSARRDVAKAGWVKDAVALTWDDARDRLLAIDASSGHLYAIDPADGTKTTVSKHDSQFPTGYARGLVIDGDRAFAIARDRNGIIEFDLDTGDREFLSLTGDGLEDPRAIAMDEDEEALVVLDHGRNGLMYIDLESGDCRERAGTHAPRPKCVGPIYRDAQSGNLCLLDGGRCALVEIDYKNDRQSVMADLAEDAPDAVDFHINPATGAPVVLERHGIYLYNEDCTECRLVPSDPDQRLGAGLALRVAADGKSALVLDSYPHSIDLGWERYSVRKDAVVRVDLETGTCTLVHDRAASAFAEGGATTGALYVDEAKNRLLLGATECTSAGNCYHGTVRSLDLATGIAESIYGVTEATPTVIRFVGGTATPPSEFSAVVRDEETDIVYTLDREQGVVGRIRHDGANPRYELISGDHPWYTPEKGWHVVPYGYGPSIEYARGIVLDADAGLLYVTTLDRVIAVDVHGGDRVVAAILR